MSPFYLQANDVTVPEQYTSAIAPSSELADIKSEMTHFESWLIQSYRDIPTHQLIQARSEHTDHVIKTLWQKYELHERAITLIAVGGYGRAELHPKSDIDLLLLLEQDLDESSQHQVSQFVTALWDLKYDVGQATRTLDECVSLGKKDVTVATTLMETRLLFGDETIYKQLRAQVRSTEFYSSKEYYLAKRTEQEIRHARLDESAYNLEPNLKENPGALRDIQTITWVAKRHYNARTMAQLMEKGYLTFEEYQELSECQEYLWQMRFALHAVTGRAENRLLFDHQPEVATFMGFGKEGKRSVERMMKRFYRVVQRVNELNAMLLQHFDLNILQSNAHKKYKETVLDDDFVVVDQMIKARRESVFSHRENLLKLFWLIAEYPDIKGIHASTIRLIRLVRMRLMGELQDFETCRRLFLKILRHPRGMGLAFTLMHKHAIIANYLPEWSTIVGQMQFDLFHAFTVDEHTHRVLKNLYRYQLDNYKEEFPLCSQIVSSMDKPELLYLAGIFHDIAKGRGGDHSELGAIDVQNFARLHELSDIDTKLITWLVENHLLMSATAQRKDIHDPDVVTEFARRVKNQTYLNYLYCLTVADIRATNDNLWNSWKNVLLRDLFLLTQKALKRGLENPMDQRDFIRENQKEALQQLLELGYEQSAISALWERFSADYFLRYRVKEIVWHCSAMLKTPLESPFVLVSESPIRGGTQIFIYVEDQPFLLSKIVSILDQKQLNKLDATIMNSKDGFALDTFIVLDKHGKAIDGQSKAQRLANSIQKMLQQDKPENRKKRLSRRIKSFTNVRPQVDFLPTTQKNHTMVEITALDMPGLLAQIIQVFHQCRLVVHSAKITTVGERAEDYFLVSNEDNTPLDTKQQYYLQERMTEQLSHAQSVLS
ncbi:[protein-PII] uridylyltransferase [Algicola sagamiensis]|uniref:[protein-PII] uridylyltransferase n=1 Tax=Algicola sagamiensis TaxID=163869 RepID=UPI0003657977|nr:[protein-PII] uridylyltransferase [Algicola sagamiensis]